MAGLQPGFERAGRIGARIGARRPNPLHRDARPHIVMPGPVPLLSGWAIWARPVWSFGGTRRLRPASCPPPPERPLRHARTCSGHPPPLLPSSGRMDTRNKSGHDDMGGGYDGGMSNGIDGLAVFPVHPSSGKWKNFHIFPARGLTGEKVVYDGSREAAPRGRLFALLQREAMAGAEKSPGGRRREKCALRLARAIRRANRAGANARWRAQARRQDTRAKRVPPFDGAGRRRRGRKGAERNAMEGTICRNGTAELRRRHEEHDIS